MNRLGMTMLSASTAHLVNADLSPRCLYPSSLISCHRPNLVLHRLLHLPRTEAQVFYTTLQLFNYSIRIPEQMRTARLHSYANPTKTPTSIELHALLKLCGELLYEVGRRTLVR